MRGGSGGDRGGARSGAPGTRSRRGGRPCGSRGAAGTAGAGGRAPRPVINATGVIIHTNLGRAPLSERALAAVNAAARGYSELEYDLATGRRGSRSNHIADVVREVTGGARRRWWSTTMRRRYSWLSRRMRGAGARGAGGAGGVDRDWGAGSGFPTFCKPAEHGFETWERPTGRAWAITLGRSQRTRPRSCGCIRAISRRWDSRSRRTCASWPAWRGSAGCC